MAGWLNEKETQLFASKYAKSLLLGLKNEAKLRNFKVRKCEELKRRLLIEKMLVLEDEKENLENRKKYLEIVDEDLDSEELKEEEPDNEEEEKEDTPFNKSISSDPYSVKRGRTQTLRKMNMIQDMKGDNDLSLLYEENKFSYRVEEEEEDKNATTESIQF
jgi:hypothetical protein